MCFTRHYQKRIFSKVFPSSGIYVIEDIYTSYVYEYDGG